MLDTIILDLPLKIIVSCKNVSQEWRQIVTNFQESKNKRVLKSKDLKLSEEWRKKDPIIHQISLESYDIFDVSVLHMIGDESHVVVAANINKSQKAKVIIIDTKAVSVTHILDVKYSDGVDMDVLEMKLAMDDNFLVAYVKREWESDPTYRRGELITFYQVWNRTENYYGNPNKVMAIKNNFCYPNLIGRHLDNIPILSDGCLQILLTYTNRLPPDQQVVDVEEWNLAKNTRRKITVPIPQEPGRKYWYRSGDGSGNVFTVNENMAQLNNYLTFASPKGPKFSLRCPCLTLPRIVGYSKDYFATQSCEVNIWNIKTGRKMAPIFDWSHFNPMLDTDTPEVKFNEKHVAFKGKNTNTGLIISELGNGNVILNSASDLELRFVGGFYLQNDGIVFENLGKIVLAKFVA